MADIEETVKELKRQQALGKIRHYGISNFGFTNMKEFNDAGGIAVTNQVSKVKLFLLAWRFAEVLVNHLRLIGISVKIYYLDIIWIVHHEFDHRSFDKLDLSLTACP